jgi:hypothetical protein
LSQISTRQSLASAITGAAGDPKKIEDKWSTNLDKFIGQYQKEDQFIYSNEEGKKIGDTLGEMSLVFYKYQTYQNDSWDVLVIDQPEDNISNPKIKSSLIRYFDNLRDKKQIVFVTHNPLLVVNQDVDNVIFIQKQNNSIQVTTGCLEDEENKILDLIADNMDGGVDTIEKRLKYYGKNT